MAKSIKPAALGPGSTVRVIAPASPAEKSVVRAGIAELERLGYHVRLPRPEPPDGYFAEPLASRTAHLQAALQDGDADAVVSIRGGYGSGALLDKLQLPARAKPKLLIGFSDVTALQIYLWQRLRWASVYGPMVAAGFDKGAGSAKGYDRTSFQNAVSGAGTYSIPLEGETFVPGQASGTLLGGCLTLIETTLATPWELDTRGAILLLEDRGLKPYQLDRMLLHLSQAGKFRGVRGFVVGEFPDCEAPRVGVTARDVCRRILRPLGVPIVYGVPVGHTPRPMLTVPLGTRVRLSAKGKGRLDILESVVARATQKTEPKR